MSATTSEAVAQEEDQYFSQNPPPRNLDAITAQAAAFIHEHANASRRVVLVTSGGTTVPLEKQTVRFIDNFSAGTRGATSAEYFLEAGYAVIFLHRQFSLQPFSRHYSHATDCFLDFMEDVDDGVHGHHVMAKQAHQAKMLKVLRQYNTAKKQNLLLMLPFVTITDYVFELRAIARLLRPLGKNALLYLAAAVSDFFVPANRMAEHKIQSTDAVGQDGKPARASKATATGAAPTPATAMVDMPETFDNFDSSPKVPRSKSLVIDLDPVPKFLKNLVDGWSPEAMIVSFKLETDPAILVHKAKYSLERYQHHLVIGNLLSTRKWEVVFVAPGKADRWIRLPIHNRKNPTVTNEGENIGGKEEKQAIVTIGDDQPLDPKILPEGDPEIEIERLIIPAVKELHDEHTA
ncbi:Phosphopantothenate--cysteine ligase cab2 [Ceratocystis pirilliformis]|uniref:Phosphopantothenate--cysteine ligase cab2 n=1 Tax=Ceratocystis pirilliformis TaxID=259994 RepID=A0ABR3Z869_9PEZI